MSDRGPDDAAMLAWERIDYPTPAARLAAIKQWWNDWRTCNVSARMLADVNWLAEQLDAVTAERDAALSDNAALVEHLRQVNYSCTPTSDRDYELYRESKRLLGAEHPGAALLAVVECVRALPDKVFWLYVSDDEDSPKSRFYCCQECWNKKEEEHRAGCKLGALADAVARFPR